jgi:predicted phage terminase large subunit-like protein
MNSGFKLISFSAIAQEDEVHLVPTLFGTRVVERKAGEALHPEREPIEVLERQRAGMRPQHFAAQYLQMPSPPGGNIINIDWFCRYTPDELPKTFDYILQSWDTAVTASVGADYSACVTMGVKGQYVWLLNSFRRKMEYPELKATVRRHAAGFKADIVIVEATSTGTALMQELRAENMWGIRDYKPIKDKVVRLETHAAMLEAGRMFVPAKAPWLHDYLHELMMFPKGRYDDQVDATSQALARVFVRGGDDAIFSYIYEEMDRKAEAHIPKIRVNHPDLGIQFHLIDGTIAKREADGSFLVTERQAAPLRGIPGIIFLDDE